MTLDRMHGPISWKSSRFVQLVNCCAEFMLQQLAGCHRQMRTDRSHGPSLLRSVDGEVVSSHALFIESELVAFLLGTATFRE